MLQLWLYFGTQLPLLTLGHDPHSFCNTSRHQTRPNAMENQILRAASCRGLNIKIQSPRINKVLNLQ